MPFFSLSTAWELLPKGFSPAQPCRYNAHENSTVFVPQPRLSAMHLFGSTAKCYAFLPVFLDGAACSESCSGCRCFCQASGRKFVACGAKGYPAGCCSTGSPFVLGSCFASSADRRKTGAGAWFDGENHCRNTRTDLAELAMVSPSVSAPFSSKKEHHTN